MSDLKPIILDETGQGIKDAIEQNTAAIIAAQNASYDEDATLLEMRDARTIEGTSYVSLGLGLRTEFAKTAKQSKLQQESADRKAEVAVERARIDAFTKMEAGSTTGDAELMDIRVGADGVTYENAGAAVRGQFGQLSSEIAQYNATDELAGIDFPGTVYNGITIAWDGHTATITGTSTALVNSNMYVNENGFPGNIAPGKMLNIYCENTDENVQLHLHSYVDGDWSYPDIFTNDAKLVQYMLPEKATGILLRVFVPAGVTVNGTFSITITAAESNSILEQGGPVMIGNTGHYMHKTIERALATYGCVTLGKGEFMVTGINMPDNTVIRGCGNATVIKAASGCDGIIVGANCTIENVSIEGADGHTYSRGTTAGIRVVGNYDESPVKFNTKINHVNIKGFSLAGIYGKSTGYWVANSISATNCKIHNCYAGILLEDYCEFGRFTNMLCYDNYAGLYNMSGNNVFMNCSFSNNTVGVYLEGGEEDGVLGGNNGHGVLIGCTINHSNNNEGYGIICRGITNGFIFDSCHVWYSKVLVEQSGGIVIQGCTFGGGSTAFTAWTNNAFFLKNCLFKEQPTFNSYNVVAVGNYLFDGTELVVEVAEE